MAYDSESDFFALHRHELDDWDKTLGCGPADHNAEGGCHANSYWPWRSPKVLNDDNQATVPEKKWRHHLHDLFIPHMIGICYALDQTKV